MKRLKLIFLCLLVFVEHSIFNTIYAQSDKAYQHLNNIMDQYHKTVDVYTDKDAGGNGYYPTKIGDYNAITINVNNKEDKNYGWSCIEINYSPTSVSQINWAGIQWLFPDTNWGYWQGRNLIGSERLNFWARGKYGGEKMEFKLGGVNRKPFQNSNLPYQDSYEQLSTGIISLSDTWQEYSINLLDTNYFMVYDDGNSGSNNRYFPSGWYNGDFNMAVDPNYSIIPYSGNSCFRVEWNGLPGQDTYKWNGILWQSPEGNWGEEDGYDLTGATKLYFWARTDKNNVGLKIKFLVGIKGTDSSGEVLIDGTWVALDTVWTKYEINLSGKDLSNIRGGFGFVFNDVNDPDPDGCVFYLDDIHFDLQLSNDLSNIIGGFVCSTSENYNPDGCTFYLDDIRYEYTDSAQLERMKVPHFLQSYVPTMEVGDTVFYNTAYIYDNALAMLAYMVRGTPEDWEKAEILGRSFIYCQLNDREFNGLYLDYRLRNTYRTGDVANPITGNSLQPLPLTEFDANTHTGNMAWVMIALLTYYEHNTTASDFLESAERIGEWIANCIDSTGFKGYYGGYEGYGHSRVLWKSTEHNIDVYAAFMKLYNITHNQVWMDRALYARELIENMWNPTDNYFWVGTYESDIINYSALVEDVQSWALLALKDPKYVVAINWVEGNLQLTSDGFTGFDFNNDLDGVWFEGTAHMALAYLIVGDTANYNFYMNQLYNAQENAHNSNGYGIVAASHDGLSTGLDWEYYSRLHVGATAWFIFADKKWNPFGDAKIIDDVKPFKSSGNIPARFKLYQNYPNPFNPNTKIRFDLPQSDRISLKIYSITGQLIKTLFEGYRQAGIYEVGWNGRDQNGHSVSSGIYLIQMRNSNSMSNIKIMLIK